MLYTYISSAPFKNHPCSTIATTKTATTIEHTTRGVFFFRNDPFYPRPGSGEAADEKLWKVFKRRFLVVSREILGEVSEHGRFLAEKLVERIEEEGRLRRRRKKELACAEYLSLASIGNRIHIECKLTRP